MSIYSKFEKLEWIGWQERAALYDRTTLKMTGPTISRLIELIKPCRTDHILDVCCGTGAVAKHLLPSGANVSGIDFAPDMIEQATVSVPSARFVTGDAQNLPFEDGSFDAVLTNFGHYHLPDPDKAIREAARVLKPGGRYGFTTWVGPDASKGFRLIFETILGNVDQTVTTPTAPDAFRLADETVAKQVLESAGFGDVAMETFPSEVTCAPDDFVAFLKAATVRATFVMKAQPENVQRRIEALLREGVEMFRQGEVVVVPMPNRIVTATLQ